MMFFSTRKALANTSGLILGSNPNTALAMVIVPGFWLPKLANATALVFPTFNWKWMRPCGMTDISGVQIFGKELVLLGGIGRVGSDEPDVESAFHQEEGFGGTGVGVGWVDPIRGKVEASHGNAESVEAFELVDVDWSHG
ncbi:hypothetical protein SASPL_138680 [Salvia splendens]|uniref:Uncharacterized protein n=1 Tax=Salvia splendens TaxID=180675 RepID=A0A8X8WV72_SALSN|nr:hypothetical protein SASPL_138680 [Salvia splendens]